MYSVFRYRRGRYQNTKITATSPSSQRVQSRRKNHRCSKTASKPSNTPVAMKATASHSTKAFLGRDRPSFMDVSSPFFAAETAAPHIPETNTQKPPPD